MKTDTFTSETIVVNLGDVHLGSNMSSISGVKKVIDFIKKTDNAVWLSTGDILDINLKNSKTFDYESMSIDKEIEMFADMFQPIAKKCLGVVGSNHHYRVAKEIGLDIDRVLCKILSLPFLGHTGFLRIIVNGCSYFVCLHHTFGFGRTRGAKANAAEKLSDVFRGYDLYLTGHSHCFQHLVDVNVILDRKHYRNMHVSAHTVTTGHFLNYDGSYAERALLPPAPKGSAIAVLNKHKEIKIDFLEV